MASLSAFQGAPNPEPPLPFAVRRRARRSPASPAAAARGRQFSREAILAKVQEWADRHGQPPQSNDWEPSRARAAKQHWRAERFEAGEWPSASMVRRQFGTFNAAIRAAGLEPREGPARRKRQLTGPDQVLAAIVEWNRRYGAPPSQTDWDAARARRTGQLWRIARYQEGDWPSLNTVIRHFGSLGRAVEQAGWRARGPGRRDQRVPAPSGPSALAAAVRAVAAARRSFDRERQRRALLELSSVALAWADELGDPNEWPAARAR